MDSQNKEHNSIIDKLFQIEPKRKGEKFQLVILLHKLD